MQLVYLVYHWNVLVVQPLTVTQGYNLEADDLNIFSDEEDMDSFYPKREWVVKNLPATSSSVTSPWRADQKKVRLQCNITAAQHLECLKRQDLWKQRSLERSHTSILS